MHCRLAVAYLRLMKWFAFQVHITTGDIPIIRFEGAIKEGTHLFRRFRVPYPLESTKDISCIGEERTSDAHGKTSIDRIELPVAGADPHQKV